MGKEGPCLVKTFPFRGPSREAESCGWSLIFSLLDVPIAKLEWGVYVRSVGCSVGSLEGNPLESRRRWCES